MVMENFTPAVRSWFEESFAAPTAVQEAAWPEIKAGHNTLIAAPTGSGKTLAAFLAVIDNLVAETSSCVHKYEVRILYISPLKALSNDIEKNLQHPLAGIDRWLQLNQGSDSGIRAAVRTGDTSPGERAAMLRKPPQILVTTPESFYLLLTSVKGRQMLSTVSTVIVDEIHALVSNKRGSHLALSLERLELLRKIHSNKPLQRIGLSATQNPISAVADFLGGQQQGKQRPVGIVDTGHKRDWNLALELPPSPLTPVMSNEVWGEIYARIETLALKHTTTLIFVNTRRLAERVARHLGERLAESIGENQVTAHHGSLAKEHRLDAEQRLKDGQLKILVATASLELGIDIGDIDLVIQLGSPGSIAALVQRVGRAGHQVGGISKGRLFPLSRDELVESIALLKAIAEGKMDVLRIPEKPLDVLAQQIVAEISAGEQNIDTLLSWVKQARPYRELKRAELLEVVEMLAQGYASRRGRRAAWLFYDAVNQRLKPRPAARLTALMNAGTIPDQFDYRVVLQPQGFFIGSLNEDFAFESLPGDIFQLGNTSYRILKIETGKVLVEDARGQPPNIPFWFGEAPGRSDLLSTAVSELRAWVDKQLAADDPPEVIAALANWSGQQPVAVEQAVEYLAATRAALGVIPSQQQLVFERFFDESGDMHLIVHSPFGSRLNRAWGLALRKRFCRKFNFELQAVALEDCLLMSLGETHSFETADVARYLHPASVEDVLIQALLDVPLFVTHWRWTAVTALAIPRMRNGKRVPPQIQRNAAEDLVAVIFPDQLACLENIQGAREVPDHPLVNQTVNDCIHEVMDIGALKCVLTALHANEIKVHCVDLNGPSPMAAEIINARPYAFLDPAPAEERRTLAIRQQPDDLVQAASLGVLQVDAIAKVRSEAWFNPRNADELHDAVLQAGFLCISEIESGISSSGGRLVDANSVSHWHLWFRQLSEDARLCCCRTAVGTYWVAAELLAAFILVYPDSNHQPQIPACGVFNGSAEDALVMLLRSRMSALGPVDETRLGDDFGLSTTQMQQALLRLEGEGYLLRFDPGKSDTGNQWCERRLLARIHRYSRDSKRRQHKLVNPRQFYRYLIDWQGVQDPGQGEGALLQSFTLLSGWQSPLAIWQKNLIPARTISKHTLSNNLDNLFLNGTLSWCAAGQADMRQQFNSTSPIIIAPRNELRHWLKDDPVPDHGSSGPGSAASTVLAVLTESGALFNEQLQERCGLLKEPLADALAELVAKRLITADSLSALQSILAPGRKRQQQLQKRLRNFRRRPLLAVGGRWSLLQDSYAARPEETSRSRILAQAGVVAEVLVRRYGIIFRGLLEREHLPVSWRYILYHLRRMEDRGELMGGRFVDGFSGEQFAHPEALALLKGHRQLVSQQRIELNSYDPLNLSGILLPGNKFRMGSANSFTIENGIPLEQDADIYQLNPGPDRYKLK
ncbi:MAG: DEAD/DEAH box helicase [Proteobacteria bacterium]|nr:DEAD/DEAH box helicase [Pseudomonadota bacterium]